LTTSYRIRPFVIATLMPSDDRASKTCRKPHSPAGLWDELSTGCHISTCVISIPQLL
jgi:hypothetical protein